MGTLFPCRWPNQPLNSSTALASALAAFGGLLLRLLRRQPGGAGSCPGIPGECGREAGRLGWVGANRWGRAVSRAFWVKKECPVLFRRPSDENCNVPTEIFPPKTYVDHCLRMGPEGGSSTQRSAGPQQMRSHFEGCSGSPLGDFPSRQGCFASPQSPPSPLVRLITSQGRPFHRPKLFAGRKRQFH